jgi:ATP-dependent Clp protease adapter protein ClpS
VGHCREYGFPSWPALKAHFEQVSAQGATSQAAFSVVVLDDDATPMQFVVNLLQEVFEKTLEEARQIMLNAHNHGVGVCGVYDRWEDAEAKAAAATNLTREHRHPLKVTSTYGDAALRRVRTQEQFSPDEWVPREQWARETSLAAAWRRTSVWREPRRFDSPMIQCWWSLSTDAR